MSEEQQEQSAHTRIWCDTEFTDYWEGLCQFYGAVMDFPERWPPFCSDIKMEAHLLEVGLQQQPGEGA